MPAGAWPVGFCKGGRLVKFGSASVDLAVAPGNRTCGSEHHSLARLTDRLFGHGQPKHQRWGGEVQISIANVGRPNGPSRDVARLQKTDLREQLGDVS
jgi:hypothetical protein